MLAGLWTVFLCVVLFLPGKEVESLGGGLFDLLPGWTDKVVHGGLFGLETWFLMRSARLSWGGASALRRAMGVAALLAVGTELAQSFIPLRSSGLGDLLANGVGIVVVALLSKGAGEGKSG